jgi:hypothetical protein
MMRWLRLEHATGSFIVKYVKSDPADLSGQVGNGIDHVSRLEYWNVVSDAASSASVKLSFADPYSGGVTNVSALRVGRLVGGVWQDAGNAGYAGTPGSNGWVSSATASGFSANSMSFALASAMGQENPLPLFDISFNVSHAKQQLRFEWRIKDKELTPSIFEIQESDDGENFSTLKSMLAVQDQMAYSYVCLSPHLRSYYRVRMKTATGTAWYESVPVFLEAERDNRWSVEGSNITSSMLRIAVSSDTERDLDFYVCDAQGSVQRRMRTNVQRGSSLISLNMGDLRAGLYFLCEGSGVFRNRVLRFLKN